MKEKTRTETWAFRTDLIKLTKKMKKKKFWDLGLIIKIEFKRIKLT